MQNERRRDYPTLIEKLEKIESRVDLMSEIIIGGDEPGFAERIRILENFFKEVKDFNNEIRKIIIGSAATIVASIFIAIIIYVILPK